MKHLNLFETEYEYINSNIEFPNISLTIDTNTVHLKEEDIVIMTSDSNPIAMEICYNQGWAANPDFMLKSEAEAVTDIGTAFAYGNSSYGYGGQTAGSLTTFHELKYFTSLTEIKEGAFSGNENLKEISIPKNVEKICYYAFAITTEWISNISLKETKGIEKIYFYSKEMPILSNYDLDKANATYAEYVLKDFNINCDVFYPKNGVYYDSLENEVTSWNYYVPNINWTFNEF